MSTEPQRVTSSAPGSRPASRAVARMSSIWLARSASVSPAAGEVPVAAQPGPPGRGGARSADVDRERPAGLGEAARAGEGVELAVEAHAVLVARPQQAQRVDRLVGAAAAGGVVDADGRGLAGQAAHPDAEQAHPALGQQVDGGQPLGQHHRLVVGQQQHPGAEQDPVGHGGHEAQALQRVGDRQVGREGHGAEARARVQRDVLGHVERLEAAGLGVPGHRDHRVGVDPVGAGVVADPELHCVLPLLVTWV